jgi:hypothetical protein
LIAHFTMACELLRRIFDEADHRGSWAIDAPSLSNSAGQQLALYIGCSEVSNDAVGR